ncbi:MAG: uracil-DNA glycosylase [Sulfurovaceae bacterium]|nr:uracil-DNA glycosylase [Sulfurovaceae bacterium]
MKNLYNALQLKQLYILRSLGYNYSDITPYKEDEISLQLPQNIQELRKLVSKCHLCELSKYRKNVVFGEGNTNAKILFVGEAPGGSEDESGKPFVGRSGDMLDKIITNVINISKEDIFITNIVKCHPPKNREPNSIEAHTCLPFLYRQIKLIKPKIVVALGGTAYHYLTGDETKMSKIRGIAIEKDDYTIVPTYHPSYLLRNPSHKHEAWEDFKKIKQLYDALPQ